MNLKMAPIRHSPMTTSITPAMMVAIISPCMPYWATMPDTITMNAPVGPPIRKREPPNTDTRKPATIAVIRPCCGVTPLAMPNAIASGRAIIPTITPAARSAVNVRVSYPPFLKRLKNLGLNTPATPDLMVISSFLVKGCKFRNFTIHPEVL